MTNVQSDALMLDAPMLPSMADNWWMMLIRGIIAILFGIAAFVWPGVTLVILIYFFAAYAIVDGVMALMQGIAGRTRTSRWWLIIVGIAGIAAGLVAILWPGLTALALLLVIGIWSIVRGVFEIIGAIRLRREIDNEWMLILGGVFAVIFGVIVIAAPGAGALALLWLIATFALVSGIIMIALAFRLRGTRRRAAV